MVRMCGGVYSWAQSIAISCEKDKLQKIKAAAASYSLTQVIYKQCKECQRVSVITLIQI